MPRRTRTPPPRWCITDVEALKVICRSPASRDPRARAAATPSAPGRPRRSRSSLGTSQTKLYHHLNLMEEHGFLRVAETRLVSGIQERRYAAAATATGSLASCSPAAPVRPRWPAPSMRCSTRRARRSSAGVRAGLIQATEPNPGERRMAPLVQPRAAQPGRRPQGHAPDRPARRHRRASTSPMAPHYGLVVAFYPAHRTGETDR